ncbi:MAG: putative LPS assembly protein LptD, partial [Flavobacteriales bacterium]
MTSRTQLALITYLVLIVSFSSFGQITPNVSDTVNVSDRDTIASSELDIDGPVKYYADDSTWIDVEHKRIILYGKAKVDYGTMVVEANIIEFYFEDYTARAYGKPDSTGKIVERVVFKDSDIEFQEDSLGYNFKTKKGISYGARTQQGEAQLLAAISKKASNDWISIGDGMLTTCNAENPHYHFRLKRAMVIPNEKVVSGPLYLQVRKVPLPLALPFGFFPNKKESTHGILLPGYGNGREKGFFVQNLGYYLPVNDYVDTKFLFDVYTRGSWAARNVTNYKRNYRYNGSFNISRVVNRTGIPELPNFSKSVNFNIQWTHNQDVKARPNSSFSSNVNLGSLNNFRNNLN